MKKQAFAISTVFSFVFVTFFLFGGYSPAHASTVREKTHPYLNVVVTPSSIKWHRIQFKQSLHSSLASPDFQNGWLCTGYIYYGVGSNNHELYFHGQGSQCPNGTPHSQTWAWKVVDIGGNTLDSPMDTCYNCNVINSPFNPSYSYIYGGYAGEEVDLEANYTTCYYIPFLGCLPGADQSGYVTL